MRKSQIKELYDKFLWLKCSMTLYYQRIKRWVNPIEALKPVEKKELATRSKMYAEEVERYKKQPQPKPPYHRFYGRLQKWYTKEEAIKIQLIAKPRKKKQQKDIYVKTYTVKQQQNQKDFFEIKIRYKKDEAKVFQDVYERMIQELENQLLYEDVSRMRELNAKIDQLKAEYQLFISYQTRDELLQNV